MQLTDPENDNVLLESAALPKGAKYEPCMFMGFVKYSDKGSDEDIFGRNQQEFNQLRVDNLYWIVNVRAYACCLPRMATHLHLHVYIVLWLRVARNNTHTYIHTQTPQHTTRNVQTCDMCDMYTTGCVRIGCRTIIMA